MSVSKHPQEGASVCTTQSGRPCPGVPGSPSPRRPLRGSSAPRYRRAGLANLAAATLQGLALLVAMALILVLLWSQRVARARYLNSIDSYDRLRRPLVLSGQVVTPQDLHLEPVHVAEAAEPDRVRSWLPEGKTYAIRVKGGLKAALKERDYGARRRQNLAFLFEMETHRTIEHNDGRRVVAVVHFHRVRMVKLLSAVDRFEIDLGPPGEPLLRSLDPLAPEAGIAVVDVAPVAYAVLGRGAQAVAQSPTSRAFLETDPLCGTSVRVRYEAGRGVESIEPIGCALDRWQAQFLFHTALLSDCCLFPPQAAKAEETWQVDARQLTGYLEPSIRGLPQGKVAVRRGEESRSGGKRYCTLRLEGNPLELRSCDYPSGFLGCFRPTGTLRFNLTDGHVEAARIHWRIDRAGPSGYRLLFENDFRGQPSLVVDFNCQLR